MPSPRVTVLIAAWNRPQTLEQAIKSVLSQTFTDWEVIVVDDGSPEVVGDITRAWQKKDPRIKYIRCEHVGKIATVSNVGLREAQGEYVAVLDDDDWWLDPKKLEKQIAFLDSHRDYIACGSGFAIVNQDGSERGKVTKPETDTAIRRVALYANPMANSTTMFRRAEAGFYDETLKQFADWDFFLRLGTKGKLYNFQEYFLAYRMWDRGSSFINQKQNADAALVIVRRYRHDYPGYIKAVILTDAYWLYARLPVFLTRRLNYALSQLKKALFSR